jgi:hypothetical protein
VKIPRRISIPLSLAFFALAFPQGTFACAVCMGGADSPVAPAINAAIFLMLGVIGAVLSGVGGFVFYLYRRSRMPMPPHEELSQLIYEEGLNRHA